MTETYASLANEFIATRSEQSFTKLFKKFKPALTGYVRKIVKDRLPGTARRKKQQTTHVILLARTLRRAANQRAGHRSS